MNRPENAQEPSVQKRNRPSPQARHHEDHEQFERSIPGRRVPEAEKQTHRVVNEDEQLKVVNEREDNAQSQPTSENEESRADGSKENERIEAADDNNEVNPRTPKVN
jgi:hypothetical protein